MHEQMLGSIQDVYNKQELNQFFLGEMRITFLGLYPVLPLVKNTATFHKHPRFLLYIIVFLEHLKHWI